MAKSSDFDRIWKALASKGKCDEAGGMEYKRVFALWVKHKVPSNLKAFILKYTMRPLPGLGHTDRVDNTSATKEGL